MPLFGYARVSTRDQDLAAQDAELMAAGCAKVFKEKISGAKTDRPELAKVIGRLEPGDVVVVTRLDRLARSTRDLLNVLDQIGKRGAGFKSLKDTWADTTTAHGRLMLTVLGGLAEFERELIRARTGEGRKRAKDRGVKKRYSALPRVRRWLMWREPTPSMPQRLGGLRLQALSSTPRPSSKDEMRIESRMANPAPARGRTPWVPFRTIRYLFLWPRP